MSVIFCYRLGIITSPVSKVLYIAEKSLKQHCPEVFSLGGSALDFRAFVRFDHWMRRAIILWWQMWAATRADMNVVAALMCLEQHLWRWCSSLFLGIAAVCSSFWMNIFNFLLWCHRWWDPRSGSLDFGILPVASLLSISFLQKDTLVVMQASNSCIKQKYFYVNYQEGLYFSWPNPKGSKVLISY